MHRHFNKRGVPDLKMIVQTIQQPVHASPEGVGLRGVRVMAALARAEVSEGLLIPAGDGFGRSATILPFSDVRKIFVASRESDAGRAVHVCVWSSCGFMRPNLGEYSAGDHRLNICWSLAAWTDGGGRPRPSRLSA